MTTISQLRGRTTRTAAPTNSVDVDVSNVAPTATFANGRLLGQRGSVSFSDQADASTALQISNSAPSATVPAAYLADGPGSRTVKGRITDSFTTILNVAPTITAPAGQSANEGEDKAFNLGSFE